MKVIDEKLDRIAKNKEPLRLQIVDARGCPLGKCGCGKELAGFFGILCIGGVSPEDPLIIFNWLCLECVRSGRDEFATRLKKFKDEWKKGEERTSRLIEGLLLMPIEDWPDVIEPDQEEVT